MRLQADGFHFPTSDTHAYCPICARPSRALVAQHQVGSPVATPAGGPRPLPAASRYVVTRVAFPG